MIANPFILSLQITCIYALFQQGNLLGSVRIKAANYLDRIFGKRHSRYIQKPLWDCLPCMASLWTIILTLGINPFLMMTVCGINVLINKIIDDEEGLDDEKGVGGNGVEDVL